MINRANPVWKLTSVICIGLMFGCASIVSKSEYSISITSIPNGANIKVVDAAGRTYYAGKTPARVLLEAGDGFFKGKSYSVIYSLPGYASKKVKIKRGVDGWYLVGNLVFGGLIGWLIVDPATGAMWTLPKQVTTTLSPGGVMKQQDNTLQVTTIDQVPSALRDKMVRVN